MFLCDKCAPKHGVSSVETLIYWRSLGECEECHRLESCMDVPFVAAQHLRAADAAKSCVMQGFCELHGVWHMGKSSQPRT